VLRRFLAWLRLEWPYVLVIAIIGAAALYMWIAPGHWRRSSGLIALALLAAAGLRFALPSERAGLLVVRGRLRDGVTYLFIGGVLLGLAIHLH
jgi:hypothetical protein